jgi:nucleotide-binding universal stress UspA family protein
MPDNKVLIAVEDEFSSRDIVNALSTRDWGEGTEFKVVHAFELPVPYEIPPNYWEARHRDKAIMEDMVTDIAGEIEKAVPGCRATGEVMEGPAKHVILETAESWQPDLIVTGSHGRGRLGRLLMGSVSHAVSKLAPCRVLVVGKRHAKSVHRH